jgi:hypothetical protein
MERNYDSVAMERLADFIHVGGSHTLFTDTAVRTTNPLNAILLQNEFHWIHFYYSVTNDISYLFLTKP